MKFTVKHTTAYHYDEPVTLGYNRAHLLPRNTSRQTVTESDIRVTPAPNWLQEHTDYFGNRFAYVIMQEPHRSLDITITTEVEVIDASHTQRQLAEEQYSCSDMLLAMTTSLDPNLIQCREFTLSSPMIPLSDQLAEFARDLFTPDTPVLRAVSNLNSRIFHEFEYDPGFTTVATPLAEVLEHKRGVCQDFAHLAIGCLRALGFPARYVSGYLETLPPPGEEKLVGSDASHAWFSVFLPDYGWYDFDPTNNSEPAEQHITTAWGRDYGDVIPLCGVFFDGGKRQKLDVAVDVTRRDS